MASVSTRTGRGRSATRAILVALTCTVIAATIGCRTRDDDGSAGGDGAGPPAPNDPAPQAPPAAGTAAKIPASIRAAIAAGEARDVLVLLDRPTLEARALRRRTPHVAPADRDEAAALRASAFAVAKRDVMRALPGDEVEARREYSHLPVMFLRVKGERALFGLAARNEVVALQEDRAHRRFLTQSLPLIDQPEAYAEGKDGAGVTVAVLDTGVDYTRAAFGACDGPGGACKVVFAGDFGPDDAELDASGHGTNVAGVVLGVAPAAKIAALDVFADDGAYTSDILAGINWVVANRATYDIAAMNMSFGAGAYSATCGGDALASAITTAREAGVLSAIATGNEGYTSQIAAPACVPDAISVGAVYDEALGSLSWTGCSDATTAADMVACFSSSASFVTMLAPGAMIDAAGSQMGGTSQAAPHVAGAIAVLRAAFPDETIEQTIARLTGTGVPITDARNGVITPRLNLDAAAAGCTIAVSPTSFDVDADGGAGSITVTTGPGCAWTAASDSDWLVITAGESAVGSGTVAFDAAGASGSSRVGRSRWAPRRSPSCRASTPRRPRARCRSKETRRRSTPRPWCST